MKKSCLLPMVVLSLFVTACVVKPVEEAPQDATNQKKVEVFPYIQLAPTEPPENPEEMAFLIVNPTKQLWRPGFWTYDGIEFQWSPGHLIDRPHPTASWSKDHWEERSYGWAFVPGFWF